MTNVELDELRRSLNKIPNRARFGPELEAEVREMEQVLRDELALRSHGAYCGGSLFLLCASAKKLDGSKAYSFQCSRCRAYVNTVDMILQEPVKNTRHLTVISRLGTSRPGAVETRNWFGGNGYGKSRNGRR